MSQDIRNFFTRSPRGESAVKKTGTEPPKDGTKKRRRKYVLSDSDSEGESNAKVSRNAKSPKDSGENLHKKKSPPISPTKASIPRSPKKAKVELAKVSVMEILGKAPVKRVMPTPKKQLETKPEFDDDQDFEAAIQQIEQEDDWFKEKPSFSNLQKSKELKEKNSEKEISKQKDKNTESSVPTDEQSKKKKLNEDPMEDSINGYKSSKEEIKSPKKSSNETKAEKKDEASSSHSEVDRKHVHNGVSGSKRKFEEPQRTRERGGSGSGSPKKHKLSAITNSSKTDVSVKSPPAKAPENVELFKLWVDKYKPTSLKQIIGQQGEKSNVNKLVRWLRDWYKNHDGTKKLTKPSPWAKDDSGAYFKAALLSGPPGVGKTTTAYLVCKELGMDIVEFNASDTRSKKLLSQEVSELLSSKSLSPFLQGGGVTKDHVLVMDEVDGMAGTEDRGGVQELIQLIKTSKVPIICMCNDRNHPKIRSLANYCFDLRFYKPRVEQIKGAMLSICFKEKLKVKPDTLVDIITSTNQDIRLTLNHLSMLAARGEKDLAAASKHVKLGPWDVLKKVFSAEDHKHMSIYDKSDLFFHDYSVAPLFVHENYLIVVPHSKEASSKRTKMELFAKAATSLCNGDLIESAIRSNNAWSLLPAQAIFSSLVPGEVLEGHVGGQINFPAWFGKNSRRNKLDRFTQELQTHSRLRISGSKSALNLDYAKPLRDHILRPLIQEGSDGVQTALATLHDYNLLREDLDSLAELNTWPGSKDPSAAIDSKVKAAFTRAYNKAPVLTPFCLPPPITKKGRSAVSDEMTMGEDGDDGVEDEEEEKEDDISTCSMITVKKNDGKIKKEKPAKEPSTSKGKGKKGKKK